MLNCIQNYIYINNVAQLLFRLNTQSCLHAFLLFVFSPPNSNKYLWADVIQFAIAKSPQHMLCCIATHTKIEGVKRWEQLSPYLRTNSNDNLIFKDIHKCDWERDYLHTRARNKEKTCDLFYPKLVHELNKRVSNKQDIRLFVFAFRQKAVVL